MSIPNLQMIKFVANLSLGALSFAVAVFLYYRHGRTHVFVSVSLILTPGPITSCSSKKREDQSYVQDLSLNGLWVRLDRSQEFASRSIRPGLLACKRPSLANAPRKESSAWNYGADLGRFVLQHRYLYQGPSLPLYGSALVA